jgi:hypothetical protein
MNELSSVGISLLNTEADETEDEKRKRLAAIQAQRQKIAGTLSPAGASLAGGYFGGLLS